MTIEAHKLNQLLIDQSNILSSEYYTYIHDSIYQDIEQDAYEEVFVDTLPLIQVPNLLLEDRVRFTQIVNETLYLHGSGYEDSDESTKGEMIDTIMDSVLIECIGYRMLQDADKLSKEIVLQMLEEFDDTVFPISFIGGEMLCLT